MTDDLRALLSVLDEPARPDGAFADALFAEVRHAIEANGLSIAFEMSVHDAPGLRSPLVSLDPERSRRRRWPRIAAAAAVLAIAVAGVIVVKRPGVDRGGLETPLRPVPTTLPSVSKTHAIVVTPSTGLRDGQIVRVSGRFAPPIAAEDGIGVQICRAGVTPPTVGDDCDGSTGQGSRLPAKGVPPQVATAPFDRFPYMVRRTITLGGQPFDCATAPGCVLYASNGDRIKGPIHSRFQNKYGVAPLAFDRVAPPLPGPSVTVTPPGALRDGDTVTVRGRHFRPFDWTWVTVCVSGTEVCDGIGVNSDFRVGPDGSFSVTHQPWSIFSAADGTPRDCRLLTCVVRVRTSRIVDVPVSFASSEPVPYPQLTVDPAGPYSDGQQVTVRVAGWPGSIGERPALQIGKLALGPCAAPFSSWESAECSGKAMLLGPDADGHYTATLTLHRTISVPGASQVDCAQPGNCRVALTQFVTPGDPPSYFVVILGADIVVN